MFNKLLLKTESAKEIIDRIGRNISTAITGLDDSRLVYFIVNLLQEIKNNVLLVAHDNYHLLKYYDDLAVLLDEDQLLVYPEVEIMPHEQIIADMTELSERISVLEQMIYHSGKRKIILVTIRTLLEKMMPVERFREYSLEIKTGQELNLRDISGHLSVLGYERVSMVESPGQFSVRGGILDIFTISKKKPYRIELFGDEVDSIREFEITTQRSQENLEEVVIPPAREIVISGEIIEKAVPLIKKDSSEAAARLIKMGNKEEAVYLQEKMNDCMENLKEIGEFPGYEQFLPYFYENLSNFLDYLPDETFIFLDQADKIWRNIENYCEEIAGTQTTLLEQGSILPGYIQNFLTVDEIIHEISNYTCLCFFSNYRKTPFAREFESFDFRTSGVEPFHGKMDLLAERLKELVREGYQIVLTVGSSSKVRNLSEFLKENKLPVTPDERNFGEGQILLRTGFLSEGFIFEDIKLAVYTDKEIFGVKKARKRKIKALEEGVKISSIDELNIGDYVVHENHGIGKYLGVQSIKVQNQYQDYLVIKYAGEDKLYVPTDQVNLVQKYIGADQNTPKLYKLGGNEWNKVKRKVQNSVREMAFGLLELYAERETIKGYAFSSDTVWQQEFEETFPFEETPDQYKAIQDVKKDMESDTPMDRLICGDVGYGKTEVAIRAAFKAVMDGKQTAVLVPTTILAQQHYNTFRERMANYPITIEMISRFKTPVEQKEILKKLALGEIDIIIGTHRLLSDDIIFSDLGLLIIDEEQRFGVSHKEKIKNIKRNVDVLTMTATPIPRTLHMALVGVRDMSVIETPPENRYPIRTYIREFNPELIRDAIRKELARGGQIYFVHNRVEDIEEKANLIAKLVPECKIAIAHGQMYEHKLERLMLDFYEQKYDLLLCTTIIETGLDVPTVNTIIINRAEQMGLAQLYQLRGRVGRSNKIAYAYLLYEKDRILPELAEKRLKAIKEFTNLGSGFKIAMRDLEIRGAGNLLGPEQHGHIASVGFSLYCKLLDSAVQELKGKKRETDIDVEIKLKINAFIPEIYISDSAMKIEIYKKISRLKNEEDFTDIIDELIDRFGDPPPEVMNLIKVSRIRAKAKKLGIVKVEQKKSYISCYFNTQDKLDSKVLIALIEKYPGQIKIRTGRETVIGVKTINIDRFEAVINDFLALNSALKS